PGLRVPDARDGVAAREGGVGAEVQLRQELRAGDRVAFGEPPAPLVADRVDDGDADRLLQAEQAADDQGALRPRARVRDEEPVPAGLGGVPAGTVGGDPVGEPVRLPDEAASLDLLDAHSVLLPTSGPAPAMGPAAHDSRRGPPRPGP